MNQRYNDTIDYNRNPIAKRTTKTTDNNLFGYRGGKIHSGGASQEDLAHGIIGTAALPLLGYAGYRLYKHLNKK